LTAESLAGIGAESHIVLQPYLGLVRAHYAVDDALIAVRNENGSSNGSSNNASTGYIARRLRAIRSLPREDVYLAVHRHEDSVYYKRLVPEDFVMLEALKQGKTLGEALDLGFERSEIAEHDRPAHLQSAFRNWMELGWFCAKPEYEGSEREG
jgi:hypothetical protein